MNAYAMTPGTISDYDLEDSEDEPFYVYPFGDRPDEEARLEFDEGECVVLDTSPGYPTDGPSIVSYVPPDDCRYAGRRIDPETEAYGQITDALWFAGGDL